MFIHAIGEQTSAFRRGRDGFLQPRMRQTLTEFADMPISVEITRTIDLSCEMIIEKIRRASVSDDLVLGDQCVDILKGSIEKDRCPMPTVAPLVASTVEKQSAPKSVRCELTNSLLPREAVSLVCQSGSHLNWALFRANVGSLRAFGAAHSLRACGAHAQRKLRSNNHRGSCGGA